MSLVRRARCSAPRVLGSLCGFMPFVTVVLFFFDLFSAFVCSPAYVLVVLVVEYCVQWMS